MKIVNLAIATCLITTLNLSADEKLLSSMKDMRNGMVQIQDGFFYNKTAQINAGIKTISKANEIFKKPQDIKKYLPANKAHMVGMTFNTAKKINLELKKISNAVKSKKFNQASDFYANIVKQCSSCHSTIRGW